MTIETPQLLPCPFCGGQPAILRSTGTIMCPGAECFGPCTTAETVEDSVVQWNTRADTVNGELQGAAKLDAGETK